MQDLLNRWRRSLAPSLIELEEQREKAKREKREDAELDEFATLRAARVSRGVGQ